MCKHYYGAIVDPVFREQSVNKFLIGVYYFQLQRATSIRPYRETGPSVLENFDNFNKH